MKLHNINENIGENIGASNVIMKHTRSRPYPKAEHLGNPFVVGSLTNHQTGDNLTCSGRPFRRISPYLLSDVRNCILHPHGVTPQSRNHLSEHPEVCWFRQGDFSVHVYGF